MENIHLQILKNILRLYRHTPGMSTMVEADAHIVPGQSPFYAMQLRPKLPFLQHPTRHP